MRCIHTVHSRRSPTRRRAPGRRSRAALAAMLSLALLVTACGDADVAEPASGTDAADDSPAGQADEPDADEASEDATLDDVAHDDAGEDATASPDASGSPSGADTAAGLSLSVDDDRLTVTAADGSTMVSIDLPGAEDERFVTAAVRPEPTDHDLDAVVATARDQHVYLHHLAVADGEAHLTGFPEHLQPHTAQPATFEIVWTPDGDSLVWTEPDAATAALRSVGWDGGPGTGERADDNATFSLDLPAEVRIDDITVVRDGRWTLELVDGDESFELTMERQADGALALPS